MGKELKRYEKVFKGGKLLIPNLTNWVISVKLLAGNKKLRTSFSKEIGLSIKVLVAAPDSVASVIKIEVKGKMETKFSNGAKKMKRALD